MAVVTVPPRRRAEGGISPRPLGPLLPTQTPPRLTCSAPRWLGISAPFARASPTLPGAGGFPAPSPALLEVRRLFRFLQALNWAPRPSQRDRLFGFGNYYYIVAAVGSLGIIIIIISPNRLGQTSFAQNSLLTPRELQSPLFRWVIQGVHLADHGGRIRYTEGLVVIGEILQGVPVLVVDFIL